jgi:hypothetical protein
MSDNARYRAAFLSGVVGTIDDRPCSDYLKAMDWHRSGSHNWQSRHL